MFTLRFDFRIKKARFLNQEGTKVETRAKVIFQDACGKRKREDPPGRLLSPRKAKEPQALKKQHGALTETLMQNPCTMRDENVLL
jgi:hypothetical protein